MHKDYTESKLKEMTDEKKFAVLYKLASFISDKKFTEESTHFQKLQRYHHFLSQSNSPRVQKINKEFQKIKKIDYQFEVYLMNLERFLGQSKKEYEFLVNTNDSTQPKRVFNYICALDSVRSAHNVGSFFRNAECFGAKKLILGGLTPTPQLPQVQKTSMGCSDKVQWQYSKDLKGELEKLKSEGYSIWSIETANNAQHINQLESIIPEKLIIVFGHEQHGISKEILVLSDKIIDIELYGSKNSLNVAVSQAIILNKITSLY